MMFGDGHGSVILRHLVDTVPPGYGVPFGPQLGRLWDARPVGNDALAFYAEPGRHTALPVDDAVSGGIQEIVAAVQGLLIYDVVAEAFYGVELSPAEAEAIHERDSARLLAAARAVDARPLDHPRPAGARVGARCHAFSRLTVAFLRASAVPARARCGFGSYFVPGLLEDH